MPSSSFSSYSFQRLVSMKGIPLIPIIFLSYAIGPICSFDEMPPLDPSISTQSPHMSPSSDSCVGQCAFLFVDQMSSQLGSNRSAGLLNLNYNEFLAAFSNATFFATFCNLYHEFNFCYTKCPHGYMQELLTRSAEIVDHFCVWNYKAIMEHFGCLAGLDRELSKKCLQSCTSHHNAVTSLMQNFKHLALNSDSTESERYLAESCEYVTCTLHCDVPAIYHLCGVDTAELVVNLTRKSFDSMQRMALDTGAIAKWPDVCADIHTYSLPKAQTKGKKNSSRSSPSAAWELTSQNGTRIEAIQMEMNGESKEKEKQEEEKEERPSEANGTLGMNMNGWMMVAFPPLFFFGFLQRPFKFCR